MRHRGIDALLSRLHLLSETHSNAAARAPHEYDTVDKLRYVTEHNHREVDHNVVSAPTPGPGRPRDPRTDQAIMLATRRQLTETGYDQVSIESIAREAGVGRPTIYRRWPSKAHVVFDAAFGLPSGIENILASSGEFASDLRRFVRGVVEFWREPVVAAAALGILAERTRDPQLQIRAQQLLDAATRTSFGALIQSGIEQRAVRPDVDIDMLFDLLVGTSFYTSQVLQRDDDVDDVIERLCSLALQGARPAPPDPPHTNGATP